MSLNVRITEERSFSTRVTLTGRLDAETAPDLDAKLDGLVNSSAKLIVFDLADLDYISSAGLRSIFRTQKLMAARSGKAVVVSPKPQVRKVFDIVKAAEIGTIFTSVEELDRYLDAMQRKITDGE